MHSHYEHMLALAEAAHAAGVNEIFVHAFTDGRDASPTGGAAIVKICEERARQNRRTNCDRRRPLFRHGSRSPLGSDENRMGRRGAWSR